MRILQIFNKYVHLGGEELAVAHISTQLAKRHEVRELIFDSRKWSAQKSLGQRFMQPFLMVWNPNSIAEVRRTIAEYKPDLILLHNLMPIGSSALYSALLRTGVPLIHFIHNFRPFSVNGYCWTNGSIQAAGLRKNFIPEILAGSWQESRLKTAWYALQLWALHAVGIYERIHGWIAISDFMAKTFVGCGIDQRKIDVIPHSWDIRHTTPSATSADDDPEPMFLFLGRLSEEKGVRILLDAWELYEKNNSHGSLIIAGEGPLENEVRERCLSLSRASHHAFVQGAAKDELLKNCAALIVPSIWWEPLGLVIFEAYEFGKPVLAARSGGILDHVSDPMTGWLHEPGDSVELANHIKEAADNKQGRLARGGQGRIYLEKQNSETWLNRFDDFACRIVQAGANLGDNPETIPSTWKRMPAQQPTVMRVMAYLADQHPKLGRSLGISRMTEVVLGTLGERKNIQLGAVISRSSVKAPNGSKPVVTVPWSTRSNLLRAFTDNLYPLFALPRNRPHIWYFPKGFMPRFSGSVHPSVATIHDTIIQYYQDHYPKWRLELEYTYWAGMLRNTLVHASAIMTVSQHAKGQIEDFINRHGLPKREIHVTYEPCLYEIMPQPTAPSKADYVLHLGSREPHKRTAWLIRIWAEWTKSNHGKELPNLHVIGKIPEDVSVLADQCSHIVHLPFLENQALISQFTAAKALLFPSEVEGFGLPAIEAYYLGTPVCFVRGTSVEEVIKIATTKGGFDLREPETLRTALYEVLDMPEDEVYSCGLILRNAYHSSKVVDKMIKVFGELLNR